MSRGSASSMFGGAGGRDSRASVSTLQGLRNALRAEPRQQQQQQKQQQAPRNRNEPNNGPVAADDKRTMKGLNDRLSGYLGRVRQLEKSNGDLEEQIRELLAKRGEPTGRDWDEIEKPLTDLRDEVREMTMENARLLLQIDNGKLANEDFKNKLETEQIARQGVERDLADLRRVIDDTQLGKLQLESQIESTKEELAFLKKDHREDVATLGRQIRDSNVTVEMDSPESKLSDTVNKIRAQYEKAAQKNREDTENWYQSKFENIKVEVARNTESLQVGRTELNDLRRQKQMLEIDLTAMHNTIRSLEETLRDTEGRYNREMVRLNHILQQLEQDLGQVREQVERQADDYQALLNVKMKLEAEIESYRHLLQGVVGNDSVEFTLEQAVKSGPPRRRQQSERATGGEVAEQEVVPPNCRDEEEDPAPQNPPGDEESSSTNSPPGDKSSSTTDGE